MAASYKIVILRKKKYGILTRVALKSKSTWIGLQVGLVPPIGTQRYQKKFERASLHPQRAI